MYFRNLESPSWRPLAGESCMAKAKVKVEQRKPVKLAYIEHTGAYDDIPFETYIGRLYGWAKKAHVRPGFYPLGVFYDSPGETPGEVPVRDRNPDLRRGSARGGRPDPGDPCDERRGVVVQGPAERVPERVSRAERLGLGARGRVGRSLHRGVHEEDGARARE